MIIKNQLYEKPHFAHFSFLTKDNPKLSDDIIISLGEDSVTELFIPYLETDSLIATFDGDYDYVRVGGAIIKSGKSVINFNQNVCFELSKNNISNNHYFRITGYNGIPRIIITTENYQPIVSKKDYVMASVKVTNAPIWDALNTICKIRGRGNTSWKYAVKSSYKIKFQKKKSLFGFDANKDWTLLAEYWDKSLLRWPFMFELSKALEIPYTVNYKHVEVVFNDEYVGTYLLTDQIERGKNRVVTDDDGFLIERDNYFAEEPLWFITDSCNMAYTFKYPDPDDGEIREGEDNYKFIVKYINDFEKALLNIDNSDDYLNIIDVNSFAKWYVHEEMMGNIDPNQFFVLRNKNSKLEMGPLWDADWSLGAAGRVEEGWAKPPYLPAPNEIIWNRSYNNYNQYLLKGIAFRNEIKNEWAKLKPKLSDVRKNIEIERERIKYAQKSNFEKWAFLEKYLGPQLTAFGSWEAEVDYMLHFFDERVKWFDSYVAGM